MAEDRLPFLELDFLYVPSADVASEACYFADVIGGRVLFAVEGMGARVAMLELTPGPPRLLLADHLDGERPILIYRVADLRGAMAELEERGWRRGRTVEIPPGPCCSFDGPGGHRIAIYEASRPGVIEHFAGRHDF